MAIGDTVAAVSTPRGTGGVAMIRITGDGTFDVARRVFEPAGGGDILSRPPRTAIYGTVKNEVGEAVDRAVMTLFSAPASFTGEDVAEITCHGGIAVTAAVLGAVLGAGAVPAEAGEFTKRAFINGKMTLSEAEATGLLIAADTDDRLRLSSAASGGALRREIGAISAVLTDAAASLCAVIDYPDELLDESGSFDPEGQIADAVRGAEERVSALIGTFRRGSAVAGGVRAVITGAPNVGKSSLFNALSGEDDAIVTAQPGTTRDVIRKTVAFGGVTLLLSDTAGIREIDNEVEKIGVDRAMSAARDAELIFFVCDSSRPLTEGEKELIKSLPDTAGIAVLNKSDLPRGLGAEDEELLRAKFGVTAGVCASSGDVSGLERAVRELFSSDSVDLSRDPVIWDERQRAELSAALAALREAREAIADGAPADAVCALCEEATARLGSTDGRGVTEDVLASIFSRFCVGK